MGSAVTLEDPLPVGDHPTERRPQRRVLLAFCRVNGGGGAERERGVEPRAGRAASQLGRRRPRLLPARAALAPTHRGDVPRCHREDLPLDFCSVRLVF